MLWTNCSSCKNINCGFKIRFYPELLLFDNEDKAFIVVGVQVAHLNRRLLLLPDSLPLPVQQLDLYVRIWRERERAFKERTLEEKIHAESPDPGNVWCRQAASCWNLDCWSGRQKEMMRRKALGTMKSGWRAPIHFNLAINLSIQMRPTV